MAYTRQLSEISKADVMLAGGKGASLGELIKAGINVPAGFVILSTAFDLVFSGHEKDAPGMAAEFILNSEIPKGLSAEIMSGFKKLGAKYVAVRSSATAEDSAGHAWAGQLETFLNTDEEALIANIKKCWASLFGTRASEYRAKNSLQDTKISVAVVIQEMIESEASGVAFSANPVTEDRSQIMIEAGFGLGEAVVSGEITPDNYLVEKNTLEIKEKSVNSQERKLIRGKGGSQWAQAENSGAQKLDDEKIKELAALVTKIESYFGFPVDVEWALSKGRLYITQSRPITTMEK